MTSRDHFGKRHVETKIQYPWGLFSRDHRYGTKNGGGGGGGDDDDDDDDERRAVRHQAAAVSPFFGYG